MTLSVGARLGPYEIAESIGAGGMGEVWRATDTDLQRDVAIKVLPESLAADAERLARLEREAQVLASLNHVNVAHVYGLERSAGATALVMELVEGSTLAERIAQGPIPVDEALDIARQIADGLEAAHERGIVHRDLKPANVKIRPDGAVKVLDFGLAKAFESRSTSAAQAAALTTPALTQAGIVLGTAAYMAPEQARGKPLDKRADIWAFGCVLYEMLTGQPAFGGEDVTVTLARVLERETDIDALPAKIAPAVRRTIELCLQKDPRKRVRDIGDVRLALEGVFEAGARAEADGRIAEPSISSRLLPAAFAAVAAGLVVGLSVWLGMRPDAPAPVRLTMAHSIDEIVGGNLFDANVAISVDGRHIAYVAGGSLNNNISRLYVRALDRLEPILLSNEARSPLFSPDGEWVGFVEPDRGLSRVPRTGGPAVPIANLGAAPRGLSWGPDDTIVYATNDPATGLLLIQAGGGTAEVLTTPDNASGELDHVFPDFLPKRRGVLFTILTNRGVDNSQIAVADLENGEYKVVIQGGHHARYVDSGHLVYAVAGTLRAVPFDLAKLEVRGAPVPVLDGVAWKETGAASFGVASNGTLVYMSGGAGGFNVRALVWVDRDGREEPIGLPPCRCTDPALAPDGTRLALTVSSQDGTDTDIWVWSFEQRNLMRLTFERNRQRSPLWTPDGQRIVYYSEGEGLYWRAADGTGTAEPLLESASPDIGPYSISVDGQVIFEERTAGGPSVLGGNVPGFSYDIRVVSVAADRTARTLLATQFSEGRPAVSSDGRWLAYQSNETGLNEIFVRPFPDVEAGKWQVSSGGGEEPTWSADGRTLFFTAPNLMAVAIETSPSFTSGTPQVLLDVTEYLLPMTMRRYAVSPDGQRFLLMKVAPAEGEAESEPSQIIVVQHWSEELERLVPSD